MRPCFPLQLTAPPRPDVPWKLVRRSCRRFSSHSVLPLANRPRSSLRIHIMVTSQHSLLIYVYHHWSRKGLSRRCRMQCAYVDEPTAMGRVNILRGSRTPINGFGLVIPSKSTRRLLLPPMLSCLLIEHGGRLFPTWGGASVVPRATLSSTPHAASQWPPKTRMIIMAEVHTSYCVFAGAEGLCVSKKTFPGCIWCYKLMIQGSRAYIVNSVLHAAARPFQVDIHIKK
jgi:hypothetical protein